jgi:hypothetical protein
MEDVAQIDLRIIARAGGRRTVSACRIDSIALQLQPPEVHVSAPLLAFVPSPQTTIPSMLPVGPLDTAPVSTETLEQMDARIAELEDEQEVLRMKAARNALTPLGRLPDELLVNIVEWLPKARRLRDTRHIRVLTAVYARLRTVLVATPTLWTTAKLGSSQALIDEHIARAQPFLLEVDGNVHTEAKVQQAIALIPCVSALDLNFEKSGKYKNDGSEKVDPKWVGEVVAALAATDISKLTKLTLGDPYKRAVDLSAIAGAHLSALALNMYVTGFPVLPQLRRLVLRNTYCTISEIHKLLAGSSRLEHIELQGAGDNTTSVPVLGRVDLSHLATLNIDDRISFAILLFGTLPNPSKRLRLHLDAADSADGILSFSAEPLRSVLARIIEFWTQLIGDDTTVPLPWIEQGRARATLSIVSERTSNGWAQEHAFLDFSASGRVLRHDPLLDEIEALRISGYTVMVDGRFDLDLVKHARRVILQGINYIADVPGQDTKPLRAWVLGQLRRGRPVQSIEFRNCDMTSIRPLFDELLQLQAAQSITWHGFAPWDR